MYPGYEHKNQEGCQTWAQEHLFCEKAAEYRLALILFLQERNNRRCNTFRGYTESEVKR